MKNFFICFLAYISGVVNGLLGSGGGTVALPMLYKTLDDERKAHNNVSLFILPLSVVSAAVYRKSVDAILVLFICLGAFFGGVVGTIFSKKIPVKYLKILFGVIIIYTGVRGFL